MLKVGDQAPDFTLQTDKGETVTLSSLRDKPDLLHVKIAESWSAGRLGLAVDNVEQVLQECNAEMNALKEALGH